MAVPGKQKKCGCSAKIRKRYNKESRKNENLVVFSLDCFLGQSYTITIESKYTGS